MSNGNHNGNGNHRKRSTPRPEGELTRLYEYIVRYKLEHDGNSPTLREMMAAIGIPSKCTASRELGELARLGFIERSANAKRGIMVSGGAWIPPERVQGDATGFDSGDASTVSE